MGGIDDVRFEAPGSQRRHRPLDLGFHVVRADIGQGRYGRFRTIVRDVPGLGQVGVFGQAAGHEIGSGVEIAGKLGHFGERPDIGFFRVRGRARRVHDFAIIREGGRVVRQGPHSGNAHVEREILDKKPNSSPLEFGDKVPGGL